MQTTVALKESPSKQNVVNCAGCGDIQLVSSSVLECHSCGIFTCATHSLKLETHGEAEFTEETRALVKGKTAAFQLTPYSDPSVRVCAMCVEEAKEGVSSTHKQMRDLGVKPCPSCGYGIQKNQGCRHMTCTQCSHEFFWCCGRAYRDNVAQRDHRQDDSCDNEATHTYHWR
jgi:hypothetical protein